MLDNNHVFRKSDTEVAAYIRGKDSSQKDIMKAIFRLCDEQFCARIFADDTNLLLIFIDGQTFKLTLEELKWVQEK